MAKKAKAGAESKEAQLTLVQGILEGIVSNKDMQEIYELVGDQIREIFDAQVAYIVNFDTDKKTEIFNYLFEDGERIHPEPRPIDNTRKHIIETKELILVNSDLSGYMKKKFGVEPEAVPGTELPKSVVIVPMIVDDTVKGCISLQNLDKENAFSDDDVKLLKTVANSVSVALENARLLDESEQRNAELAVINSVQHGLVAEMDMQGIYDLVGETIREVFDAKVIGILSFDLENEVEHFNYLFEDGERFYPDPRPIDLLRKEVIETKKTILVNHDWMGFYKEKFGTEPTAVPGTELPKSVIFVPMVINDQVTGYISLQNTDREYAFSENDTRLLNTIVNSVTVALENARLFNETEQRNAELGVINSVQQGLVAEMNMKGIYELVGEKVRELFDAQVVAIANFDYDAYEENFHYIYEDGDRIDADPRPIDRLRKYIIDTKRTINISENASDTFEIITGEVPKAVPGTRLLKSAVYVPLVVGEETKGYVSLQNLDREHAFSESDIRLLETLANGMSVALENARLFNETEQRNAELAVINSVQQGLVAEMDMQGIYDLVGERIKELFDAQVVAIGTFNHEKDIEEFKYLFEDGGRLYPKPRKIDKIRKRLINTNRLILVNENTEEAYTTITGEAPQAVPGTTFPKSMVYVPLSIGESVRGYVTLQNLDRENAFSESDVRLLGTLSNSMSVALENARLFNETEQRNAELAVINSVQQGLVAEMDMQGIYDLVGDRVRDLSDAQVTSIVTFDLEKGIEEFQYLYEDGDRMFPRPRPYDKFREKIIEEKETIILNENAAEQISKVNGQPHKAVPGTRIAQSGVFVPMMVGDTVRGYVTLQNVDRENAFDESDVRLLKTLVNSMSVALENARLFNETTRLLAETEQRNAELAVINSIQEGLVREMDLEAIYSLVGTRISDILNTQSLLIRTFDHKKGLETWEYVIENGKRLYSEPKSLIWANKRLIETGESIVINKDYEETALKYGGTGVSKGEPPKSAVFVPMIVGDEVIGSVSSQNIEEENAFSESDVRLLTTLTNSMSVALENARLFNETRRLLDETEQRASELQTVNSISKALVSQLKFDALVELVGEQMRKTFKADIVYLAMHDRKTNMLNFPYIHGEEAKPRPFGNGITEKIIKSKEPLLINHDMKEAYDKLEAEQKGTMVQSYLGVPILAGKHAIGVISVQSTETENRFNEYDQRLLSTIAANVGVAIQNSEAYQNLHEALDELRSAQEQLVQQEKLASLGQLTAGIAHEIKNPLNFVNNFSDLSMELIGEVKEDLEKIIPSDNKDHEDIYAVLADIESNLSKIHQHGTRADGIVKSMLQHSRGGSGKMEPTELNPTVKEYVNLAFHGMRASKNPINVDINLDLGKKVGKRPLIVEDFSRVILNICNNAFDAMREKSNNLSKKDKADYKAELSVKTGVDGTKTFIKIRDNGPGIPDKIKDQIMQPFFTTKKGKEGTGLGLSISNDIIKAHGGVMEIDSKEGKYTEFSIYLNQL